MNETIESRMLRALGTSLAMTVLGAIVLWALFVPNFSGSGRLNANESSAIATLRNIHTAQSQFQAAAAIDRDGDGRGEYGWFLELAGGAPLRGTGAPLHVPALSRAFARQHDGRVARSGYWFAMWLPAKGGGWLGEGTPGAIDADAAEAGFRCGVWPLAADKARRAFFTDAEGSVWACSNSDWRYCGIERPLPGAALVPPSAAAMASMVPAGAGDWIVVQ